MFRIPLAFIIALLGMSSGCQQESPPEALSSEILAASEQSEAVRPASKPPRVRTLGNRLSTAFTPVPHDILSLPQIREIEVPDFPGAYAIWGATGRDDQGTIWFGVSSNHGELPSAHLFSFDPTTDQVTDLGDVVGKLREEGVYRSGESQMKIHSKIVHADDGYLYFASMDESGEKEMPLTYPIWGGHLWRTALGSDRWEHLLATKESLIAVSSTGKYIYALGYYNHVLYQYDTTTGMTRKAVIGSWGAHISRNFLTDLNDHVYVPRVVEVPGNGSLAFLVELDEKLDELQSVPLTNYKADPSFDRHGIIGFAHFKDGSIIFSSHSGFLWRVRPHSDGPAEISQAGWLHPDGESYPASIYTFDGQNHICGLVHTKKHGFQWFVRSMKWNKTILSSFKGDTAKLFRRKSLLLYGTNTRDDLGNGYLVGRYIDEKRKRPILLKVAIPQ